MDYIKVRFGNEQDTGSGFDRSVEDIFRTLHPMMIVSERIWKPHMDIYETEESIFILAEIAGVQKENLEVEINRKAVRIFGVRPEVPRVKETNYRLAEIQYGRFERILFLPVPVDTEKVNAVYNNGFLQIQLAKLPREKTVRISIQNES